VHFGGPRIPADASEAGWKDTVRADPAMVTRIIIKFEGYAGRYVWHCHILEHEDNEMMRPYDVIAAQ
jgi:spore coat protein A